MGRSRRCQTCCLLPLLSAAVLAAPLAYPISRSRPRGRALFGAVFVAAYSLVGVLTQIESAVFLNMTPGELWAGVLELALVSAALSWLAVNLYPKLR